MAAASVREACDNVSVSESQPNFVGDSNERRGDVRTTAVTKHSVDNRSLIASATAASLFSSTPEGGSVRRNRDWRDEARAPTFKHQHETRAVAAREVWLLAKALFQFENRAVAGGLHDDNARSIPATAPHPNAPDRVASRNSAPFYRRLFIRHHHCGRTNRQRHDAFKTR